MASLAAPRGQILEAGQNHTIPLLRPCGRSSNTCRAFESQVAALLPMRDAVATELMASVADVQQACQSSGF